MFNKHLFKTGIIFCFFVVFITTTFSQTYLGLELHPFFISADNINPQISPYSFSLTLRQEVGPKTSLSIKPGFSFLDTKQYSGFDLSVSGQYLLNEPLYIFTGLCLHNNSNSGTSLHTIFQKAIIYYVFGLGFNISSVVNAEFGLHIPIKNKVYGIERYSYNSKELEIDFLFKFGVGVEFEL